MKPKIEEVADCPAGGDCRFAQRLRAIAWWMDGEQCAQDDDAEPCDGMAQCDTCGRVSGCEERPRSDEGEGCSIGRECVELPLNPWEWEWGDEMWEARVLSIIKHWLWGMVYFGNERGGLMAERLNATFANMEAEADRSTSPRPRRRKADLRKRWLLPKVLEQKMLCGLCGEPMSPGDELHLDHIKPFCAGGTDEPGNLQATHKRCNLSKGGREGKRG